MSTQEPERGEQEEGDPEKVVSVYDDVKFEGDDSSYNSESYEDEEGERSRSPSPVYETITEKSAKTRHSPREGATLGAAGTKAHKFLRRHLSDQLVSTSLLSLFNRKPTGDSTTLPARTRPHSTAEPLESSFYELSLIDPEPMSLMDLVRKHARKFPLRVTVEQGFCSNVEEGAIGSGETYNIHFLKYTKVVYLSTKDSPSLMYAVPLNSAVQFGLVYNPHNYLDQALQGVVFETVGDILAVRSLPKIIRATSSYQGANASSSVEENELLIVKNAKRPKVLGSPHLKVYSVTTGENKSLPMQCAGNFTTKPQSVCLHLPEILKHVTNALPTEAVMYIDRNTCNYEFVPENLMGEVVTLAHSSIETSLVATAYSCEFNEEEAVKPADVGSVDIYDIPVSLEVEIKVDQLLEEERQALSETTVQLYQSFDPEKLVICKPFSSSDCFHTQLQLYRVIHHNRRLEGIQIEKPKLAFANTLWKTNASNRHSCLPDVQEVEGRGARNGHESFSEHTRLPVLPPRTTKMSSSQEESQSNSRLQQRNVAEYEVPVLRSPIRSQDFSPSGTPQEMEGGRRQDNEGSEALRSPPQSPTDQSSLNRKDATTEEDSSTASPTLQGNQTSFAANPSPTHQPLVWVDVMDEQLNKKGSTSDEVATGAEAQPHSLEPDGISQVPLPNQKLEDKPKQDADIPKAREQGRKSRSLSSRIPEKPTKPATAEKAARASNEKTKVSKQRSLPTDYENEHEDSTVRESDANRGGLESYKGTETAKGPDQSSAREAPKPELPPKPKLVARRNGRTNSQNRPSNEEHIPIAGRAQAELPDAKQSQVPAFSRLLKTCEELQSRVMELEQVNKKSTTEIEALRTEQSTILPKLDHAMEQQELMLGEIQQLRKELSKVSRRFSSGGGGGSGEGGGRTLTTKYSKEEERRREELSKLDCEQVATLLDRMSLQQHKGTFTHEGVDGEILLECDSEVLQHDLGVTSKLHRAKLLRLIAGQHTVMDI